VSKFNDGDRVRTTQGVGGWFGDAVPHGTEGRVTRTEHGLFEERVVVEFPGGRTETVSSKQLERVTGWF
jgi:hypothetical protein